jgi:hypothetical protein
LRSLWAKARGSSSLLGRTTLPPCGCLERWHAWPNQAVSPQLLLFCCRRAFQHVRSTTHVLRHVSVFSFSQSMGCCSAGVAPRDAWTALHPLVPGTLSCIDGDGRATGGNETLRTSAGTRAIMTEMLLRVLAACWVRAGGSDFIPMPATVGHAPSIEPRQTDLGGDDVTEGSGIIVRVYRHEGNDADAPYVRGGQKRACRPSVVRGRPPSAVTRERGGRRPWGGPSPPLGIAS